MRFELVPFDDRCTVKSLHGSFELMGESITCRWILIGASERVLVPRRTADPDRKMSLWEHTCFEFFIGAEHDLAYYEFNLCPSGHWNSFSFRDVREGMAETDVLMCTASSAEWVNSQRLNLAARVSFAPPVREERFRVGVSAVIEQAGGKLDYFALSHDGGRPDFHRRSNHRLSVG